MSNLVPHYVREGNQVLAIFEDRVIAHGPNFSKVEETAVDYLDTLKKERDSEEKENAKKAATHIVTPNGLKGKILSRVEGIWGDQELTVRFDNGRVLKFEAHSGNDDHLQYTSEAAATPSNPIEALQAELDEDFGRDKKELTARLATLDGIVTEVSAHLSKGAAYADEQRLSKIALAAEHEKGEIQDALSYLEQADAELLGYTPPVHSAVEQADLGRAKGDSWLDNTVQAMIDENKGVDYDKMLAEEPVLFIAGLETGTLSDTRIVRELAYSHITSKTASFTGTEVDSYRDKFVAAVEMARRVELATRTTSARKVASAQADELLGVPDDALFLGR